MWAYPLVKWEYSIQRIFAMPSSHVSIVSLKLSMRRKQAPPGCDCLASRVLYAALSTIECDR